MRREDLEIGKVSQKICAVGSGMCSLVEQAGGGLTSGLSVTASESYTRCTSCIEAVRFQCVYRGQRHPRTLERKVTDQ